MKDEIKETIDYLKAHEINLAFRINELLKYVDELQEENEDYKLKCEKAIEYIKMYKCDYSPYELTDSAIRNVLNILTGGDEE